MILHAHRRWSILLVAGALSALSCDSQTEVRSTIPRSNSRDVDPRTVVAVRLSNSVADTDAAATDAKNITVTGDLSGEPYSGTIQLAHHDDVFHGQTVEEFEPEGNADPDAEPRKKDTIVFLLASGTSFKDGETVNVFVNHDVTAKGTPLRRHKRFSFRVRSGSGSTGELRVSSTSPATGDTGVNARPRVTAGFSRAVRPDALAASISLRGAHSGVHKGGETIFSKSDSSTQIREVVRRLAVDDAFLPGEMVSVTYGPGILEAGTAAAASAVKLSPYHLEFQVESGAVKADWSPLVLPEAGDGPVALVAADFRPAIDGTELAIVTREDLVLFSQTAPRVWSRVVMPLPLVSGSDAFEPIDAIAYDTKDDGTPEILLLLGGANGSRLVTIEVAESGALSVQGKTVDWPAVGVGRMTLADLDANGKPEILVSHPSRKVPQGPGQPAKDTGALSILELKLVPPDPEDIDPSDPDSLLPTLTFQVLENPVQGFKPATRIEAADLNVDGKLDLVCETEEGLVLFRNIGNASTQFALRSVGQLLGRTERTLSPLAWVLIDIDSDGDLDILAWDVGGALLHRNRQGDGEGDDSMGTGLFESPSVPVPLTRLPVLLHRALARALDLDGDAAMDIALVMSVGGVTLLVAMPSIGDEPEFRSIDQPSASESPGIVAADLDGDSGLDIATTGLPSGNVHLLLAEGVDEPSVFIPSSMRFAAESTGLTDLDGDTVRVAILGDFTEAFTGYSIALDHDEAKLKYKGFEVPGGFERNAAFTLCPDVNLQGCAGNVSVRMSYLQGTRGAPASGILLGTLLFEKSPVTTPSTTNLELKSFQGPNQTTFDNTLIVMEGGGSANVPLLLEEGILEVPLLPPAPSSLDAQCVVLGRGDASLDGTVTWSSPAGTIFKEFRIEVGGQAAVVVSGTTSFHDFTTSLTGLLNVRVTGVDQANQAVSATCQVIGIHRPTVNCVPVSSS
ncbi:MAG TPA: VCBS repeat-containing protein, partial [Planctomycetota bacterium]|nr:VCBS repeat-containing protein [Planctomycetota bacterium]